ncbi:MAG: hypothetical protein OXI81_02015 [Paracoccaceae bacterium]|nr:hypothetical protein [Paracoccaceae bacterium]
MTIRETLIATSILLSSTTSVLGQSEATSAAYMDADAMFHESTAWRTMASVINDPEMAPVVDPIGAPTGRKGFNAAAEKRRRAYLRAYEGPVSDHDGVMWKLLLRDRRGCRMKRCPLDDPGLTLKPIGKWPFEDHRAFVRFVRSGS